MKRIAVLAVAFACMAGAAIAQVWGPPPGAYYNLGEASDAGRWQYESLPVRKGDIAEIWRIDVFTQGYDMPNGEGAYAVAQYLYNCRERSFRIGRAELYDQSGKVIDQFEGPPFARIGKEEDTPIRVACDGVARSNPTVEGLWGVLDDARTRGRGGKA